MRARLLLSILLGVGLLAPTGPAHAEDVDTPPVRSFAASTDNLFGMAQQPGTGRLWTVEKQADTKILSFYEATATGFPTHGAVYDLTGCGTTFPAFNAAGSQIAIPCSGGSVLRYSVGPDAAVTPLNTLTGAGTAYGVAIAADGDVFVPDQAGDVVRVYEPGVSTAVPARTISGPSIDAPTDVFLGPDGNTYVLNNSGAPSVTVYAPGANGVTPPLRTITVPGGPTELYSLAVDDGGHVYVGGFSGGVMVFAPGPAGGSTPLRWLNGPATGLAGIVSIAIDRDRRLVVGEKGNRIATFPALVPYRPPVAVRSLKVGGAKTDMTRLVTWTAPAVSERPVTSYVVTVKKRSRTVLTKTVSARKLVLKRKKLPVGKLKVSVVARSSAGSSPAVTVRFTVKLPK